LYIKAIVLELSKYNVLLLLSSNKQPYKLHSMVHH